MKISHEEYLKQVLRTKKMELENLQIEHRIANAEYNTKFELIRNQIYSIEDQLDDN